MSIIIAENITRVFLRELCKNLSRRDMFRLQSTVGQEATRAGKAYELATEAEMQEMATSWSNFHQDIAHDSYATFHSKMKFCQSNLVEQLSDNQFKELIADQKFLFFHYSESTNCPSFPTFRTIIEAKNQYFDIPKLQKRLNSAEPITSEDLASLITISDTHVAKEADVQKKFEYGLLGSTATWDDYCAGKAKLVHLQEAITQRSANLNQYPVNKLDYFNQEPISIPRHDLAANKQQSELNEKDFVIVNQLCELFVQFISNKPNYTDALARQLKEHAPKNMPPDHPQIKWLYSELKSKDNLNHNIAIYFYHLFVKYTLKLSKGTAIRYVLKPTETKRKQYLKSSEQVQRNTQNIIQRNLVLWGRLMTLFSPSAESRLQANMEFWALTRYDHYMHCSKVPREYHMCLNQYPFVYTADYTNPVDALGYVLRRNIEHCIPCELNQMVIPLLFADTGRGLTILDLLVQDAFSTPAYNRLADRIRRSVDENIIELAEEYQSKESTGDVSVYLESYCKKHGLYFDLTYTYHEIKIRDNLLGTYNNEASSLMERFYKSYPQILVEHRINTHLLQPAKRTLYHKAKNVFSALLFEDTILNPWKDPEVY